MKITRTSPFSGFTRTLEINVTQEQLDEWKNGMLIQDAMPHLSAGHREFIKTGLTDEDWKQLEHLHPAEYIEEEA